METTENLRVEIVTEFKGEYPELPTPSDIDLSAFSSNGEKPVFVVLPIGKVGQRSRNQTRPLKYSRTALQRIVEQINTKRPEGEYGHPEPGDAKNYQAPAVRWLSATIDDEGRAWGKLVATRPDSREHLRVAKATNASVATSVYGTATHDGETVWDYELDRLDLADPSRAGIADAIGVPHLVYEMFAEYEDPNHMDPTTIQTQQRDGLITSLQTQIDTYKEKVSEMTSQVSELAPYREIVTEMAAVFPGTEMKQLVSEMTAVIGERDKLKLANQELKKSQLAVTQKEIVSEMVKVEKLRPIVSKLIGTVESEEDIRNRVKEILEDEDIKALTKSAVSEMSGPAAIISLNTGDKPTVKIDDDFVAKSRASTGI